MLFNTFRFWIFFIGVFTVHFTLVYRVRRVKAVQIFLLACSLFFYACWNPRYLILILISVITTWIGGIALERRHSAWILVCVLGVNLSILFVFKYFNFMAETICLIFKKDIANAARLEVALPVGISFYTFQALGYAIDVWRRKLKAEKSFLAYSLFVTFFPQLVAGPIERTENLLPSLKRLPKFDYDKTVTGLRLCLWGMVKKVLFADTLSVFVEKAYSNIGAVPGVTMCIATVFFAFQVLCDFSAYSDIARGAARILGYELMQNFDRPYLSHSVGEFWRRWHISLSSWLRDYVYIPLGGSRAGRFRTYLNLMITFLVSGLWHGAAMHFVVWGALHGAVLCIERGIRDIRGERGAARKAEPYRKVRQLVAVAERSVSRSGPRVPRSGVSRGGKNAYAKGNRGLDALCIIATFIAVVITWAFFRADTAALALEAVRKMISMPHDVFVIASSVLSGTAHLGGGFFGTYTLHSKTVFMQCVLCVIALALSDTLFAKPVCRKIAAKLPSVVRWAGYYVTVIALLTVMLKSNSQPQFIYFQF